MPLWLPLHGRARARALAEGTCTETVDGSGIGTIMVAAAVGSIVTIESLPDVLLARIFEAIRSARTILHLRGVCHRWARVLQTMARVQLDLGWADKPYHDAVTDDVLQNVLSNHPKATMLNLRHCQRLGAPGFAAIGATCSSLTEVCLYGCPQVTDEDAMCVFGQCHQLLQVDLSGCTQLGDVAMAAIGNGCPGLRSLNLFNCRKVTDRGMEALCSGCTQLRVLKMSWCLGVTDATLETIGSRLGKLHRLKLRRCDALSGPGLGRVLVGCRDLQFLGLDDCDWVTDTAMVAALDARPPLSLQHLVLSGCTGVGDRTARAIPVCCPGLVGLDARWCESLTAAGVEAVVSGCPALRRLRVTGCPHIDGALLDDVLGCFPAVACEI